MGATVSFTIGEKGDEDVSAVRSVAGAAKDPDAWMITAGAEARQKAVKLTDFVPPPGSGRSPGHAHAGHGWKVTDQAVLDIRNNPDKIYVGTNEHGNRVTIFLKDENVVISEASNPDSVITAYGKDAPQAKQASERQMGRRP